MKLLVIEDHPGMRALIVETLRHLASEVRESASGEQALLDCVQFVPDCVTVDLRLGGMDGLQVLRRLRKLFPESHLVMFTQFGIASIRQQAATAGADHFFVKDRLSDLSEYLQSWVDQRRSAE